MEGSGSLGSRLKHARELAGLEQAEVAQHLGVDPMTVSRWERGKHSIKAAHLAALAKLYGVTVEALSSGGALDENVAPETAEPYLPNPALARNVPARAYEIALSYLRRLERIGVSHEDLARYESQLLDNRFGVRRSQEGDRPFTENDWILLIESTWVHISDNIERDTKVRP